MESSGWVSVRCVFRLGHDSPQAYEERVTLWQTDDFDTAIEWAEAEASDHAKQIDAEYLGLAQAYVLSDPSSTGRRCSA